MRDPARADPVASRPITGRGSRQWAAPQPFPHVGEAPSCAVVSLGKNDFTERASVPRRRVRSPQRRPRTMPRVIEKPLQRHESLAEPHADPETEARLVRSAQHPCVVATKRVRPKRRLAPVQHDVGRTERQFRARDLRQGGPPRATRAAPLRRPAAPVAAAGIPFGFRSRSPRQFRRRSRLRGRARNRPGGPPG